MPALTIHCASRLAREPWARVQALAWVFSVVLLPALAGAPAAAAGASDGCSRAIMVPVSPLGTAMMIGKNQEISGIMVTMLREVERRSQCPVQFFIVRPVH